MSDAAALTVPEYVRLGVMEILVSMITHPAGTMDVVSIKEMVRLCLLTNAWCVREETYTNLRKALETAPIGQEVLANLQHASTDERVDVSTKLAVCAQFHAQAFHCEPPPKKYMN